MHPLLKQKTFLRKIRCLLSTPTCLSQIILSPAEETLFSIEISTNSRCSTFSFTIVIEDQLKDSICNYYIYAFVKSFIFQAFCFKCADCNFIKDTF